MKKLFTKLTMLLIALTLSTSLMAQTYSGGSGTSGDPYQIANKADLEYLSENSGEWTEYFIQTANIVFVDADFQSGGAFYNGGEGFIPIGNNTTKFTGSYDGDNYEISNLYINRAVSESHSSYLGFFGYANGATFTDITIIDADISGTYYYFDGEWTYNGSQYIGGLVGYANSTTISACSVSGDITGYKYIGGLIGVIYSSSTITNCNSSGSVTVNLSSSRGGNAGGFTGAIWSADCSVSNSSSTANIVSSSSNDANYIGGFIGSHDGDIEDCYATGNITGKGFGVGGFVGLIEISTVDISSCYSQVTLRVINA